MRATLGHERNPLAPRAARIPTTWVGLLRASGHRGSEPSVVAARPHHPTGSKLGLQALRANEETSTSTWIPGQVQARSQPQASRTVPASLGLLADSRNTVATS